MRKKIPTITRPDLTYAASLRPEVNDMPEREVVQQAEAIPRPKGGAFLAGGAGSAPRQGRPTSPATLQGGETTAATAPQSEALPSRARRMPATRKIDIRVNALERQEEALIDCGVDPAHVIRAALRRAIRNWELAPDFAPPSEERRTRITEWRARTSLAVNADALASLLRIHDPLDVLSKWALIRGQLEPRVWSEIDTLLAELMEPTGQPGSS